MSNKEIKQYYEATTERQIRSDLGYTVNMVPEPRIAIDCGCGAGADIEFLLTSGFKVYAFDIEAEAISRCEQRFKDRPEVILSRAGFGTYKFPRASLVVADASLFFCPREEFAPVWNSIYASLYPDGVFCGSFLGPKDTMAGPEYDATAFWPATCVFAEDEVRELFKDYQIYRFTEHKSSGKTAQGIAHDWHIFSVVAKKIC